MTGPQIIHLQHLAGAPRVRVVLPEPAPVFVAAPQRLVRDAFGAVTYVTPGHTHNPGHAELLAWLVPPGSDAPDYCEVRYPSGANDGHVPVDWLHDAIRIATLRPQPHPAQRRLG